LRRRQGGGDAPAEAELCRRLAPRVRLYGLKHLGCDHCSASLQALVDTAGEIRAAVRGGESGQC